MDDGRRPSSCLEWVWKGSKMLSFAHWFLPLSSVQLLGLLQESFHSAIHHLRAVNYWTPWVKNKLATVVLGTPSVLNKVTKRCFSSRWQSSMKIFYAALSNLYRSLFLCKCLCKGLIMISGSESDLLSSPSWLYMEMRQCQACITQRAEPQLCQPAGSQFPPTSCTCTGARRAGAPLSCQAEQRWGSYAPSGWLCLGNSIQVGMSEVRNAECFLFAELAGSHLGKVFRAGWGYIIKSPGHVFSLFIYFLYSCTAGLPFHEIILFRLSFRTFILTVVTTGPLRSP